MSDDGSTPFPFAENPVLKIMEWLGEKSREKKPDRIFFTRHHIKVWAVPMTRAAQLVCRLTGWRPGTA